MNALRDAKSCRTAVIAAAGCAESKLGRGSASRAGVIVRELLFGKFCFFQQQCLHIGQDESRIEGCATIDVPDTAFSVDEKDPQNVIQQALRIIRIGTLFYGLTVSAQGRI
jgi:hypothetical protein